MDLSVTSEIEIALPPDQVFDYISKFENITAWAPIVVHAEQTSTGPIQTDTTGRIEMRFLGKTIRGDTVITDFDPNHVITFHTTQGSMWVDIRGTVEPVDGGTRYTQTASGESHGLFRLATPLLYSLVRQQQDGNLRLLKAILESSVPAS